MLTSQDSQNYRTAMKQDPSSIYFLTPKSNKFDIKMGFFYDVQLAKFKEVKSRNFGHSELSSIKKCKSKH